MLASSAWLVDASDTAPAHLAVRDRQALRNPTGIGPDAMNDRLHDASSMRLEGLDSRIAVVTGAASGIGQRISEVISALGARVAGIDVHDPGAGLAVACLADVSDATAVDESFGRIESELGEPEILVTSAGVFRPAVVEFVDAELWRRTVDINLTGTFLCAQRVLPAMRRRGYGRIVMVSSAAGIDGGDTACAHYAASKGGVNALCKALAKEVAPDGVTVNVVAPRNVRTPMIAGELVKNSPVGRLGSVDDIAAAIAFLCSDHAAYITGEVLALSGGAL